MKEQKKEFTEIKSWKMLTGSGVKIIRNCTYIEMMEDFFEGYNIPREYNLETKEVEAFESANDRVYRYLNITKPTSDRDKFAIEFAEWLKLNDDGQTPTSQLLELFRQSLKTDNK